MDKGDIRQKRKVDKRQKESDEKDKEEGVEREKEGNSNKKQNYHIGQGDIRKGRNSREGLNREEVRSKKEEGKDKKTNILKYCKIRK